LKPRF